MNKHAGIHNCAVCSIPHKLTFEWISMPFCLWKTSEGIFIYSYICAIIWEGVFVLLS